MSACGAVVAQAERESSNASCDTVAALVDTTPLAGIVGPFASSAVPCHPPPTAPAMPGPYSSASPSFMTQAMPPKGRQPRSPREQVSPKRARTGATEGASEPVGVPLRKACESSPSPALLPPSTALQQHLDPGAQQRGQEEAQQEDGAVFSPVFHCLGLRSSLEGEAGVAAPAPAPASAAPGPAQQQQQQPLGLGIPGVGAISCVAPAARPQQRWGDKQSPRYQHHGGPTRGGEVPGHAHQDAQEHDQGAQHHHHHHQQEQQDADEEEMPPQEAGADDSSSGAPLVDDTLPPVLQLSLPPTLRQAAQQQQHHHQHHHGVVVHALPHPHAHPNHPIIPEAAEHELPPPSTFDVDVGDQGHQPHTPAAAHDDPDAMAVTVAVVPGAEGAGSALAADLDPQQHQHQQHEEQQQADELDYMDFDPLLFIKLLPPLEEVVPQHRAPLLPRKPRHCKAKTLVLDLDETLVHSCLEASALADFTFPVHFNSHEHIIHVRQRPHLHTFLERVAELYEVVVFTASQKIYAEKLLNIIDPERRLVTHRIFRESCVVVDGNYLKDLSVLGRDLRTTLIVDNSPQAFGFQVDNGVPIESWYDDPADVELLKLLPFLEALVHTEDVRPAIRSKFRLRELIDRVVC